MYEAEGQRDRGTGCMRQRDRGTGCRPLLLVTHLRAAMLEMLGEWALAWAPGDDVMILLW